MAEYEFHVERKNSDRVPVQHRDMDPDRRSPHEQRLVG